MLIKTSLGHGWTPCSRSPSAYLPRPASVSHGISFFGHVLRERWVRALERSVKRKPTGLQPWEVNNSGICFDWLSTTSFSHHTASAAHTGRKVSIPSEGSNPKDACIEVMFVVNCFKASCSHWKSMSEFWTRFPPLCWTNLIGCQMWVIRVIHHW